MALGFNAVSLPTAAQGIAFNAVLLGKMVFNSSIVWELLAPSGSQTFTSSGTFTVPEGHYSVNICMAGGGGSGASGASGGGGGYAGGIVSGPVAVTPGEEITVTIGAGGASYYSNIARSGNSGGASIFYAASGTKTASGGSGGIKDSPSYGGIGASRSTCGGTRYDGRYKIEHYGYYGYGGQAGAYGNGSDGEISDYNTSPGGVSAGSGGGTPNSSRGAGGRGHLVVSW